MTAATDRSPPLVPLQSADYRLCFGNGADFAAMGGVAFDPEVSMVVQIDDPTQYYYVHLLVSPFGYGTYRGR